jgi:hypothetical protein
VFVACDANLALIVMLKCVGGTFDLGFGLPPSEVKPWFAPSEVHYSQFHLGGARLVFAFFGFTDTKIFANLLRAIACSSPT